MSVVESVPSANVWLTPQPGLEFTPAAPAPGTPEIVVNDAVSYQVVQGFGAAMTDSSAWLIEDYLDAPARAALLSELFGPNGIHLNFLRVPIGASDYTATAIPYSYDDLPPGETDPTLQHFSIKHDLAYILPALRQVLGVNASTELLASPWSAPAWMKRNDSLSNVGNKGKLLAKDYGVWAQYIVKFLQAYAAAGHRHRRGHTAERARQPDFVSGHEHLAEQPRHVDRLRPGPGAPCRAPARRRSSASTSAGGRRRWPTISPQARRPS